MAEASTSRMPAPEVASISSTESSRVSRRSDCTGMFWVMAFSSNRVFRIAFASNRPILPLSRRPRCAGRNKTFGSLGSALIPVGPVQFLTI